MQGLMMDMPLQISQLIRHADRHHGAVEIVSKTVDGGAIHRYTYREAHARARQLANALKRLGVQQTDRVATLGWNSFRHAPFSAELATHWVMKFIPSTPSATFGYRLLLPSNVCPEARATISA